MSIKYGYSSPYDGKWSKTMVGYGPEDNHFVAELTYNYGIGEYRLGNDFLGITLVSGRAVSNAKKMGWPLKEVTTGVFETEAPGGYKFYLEDKEQVKQDPVLKVTLGVSDLQNSVNYWSNLLGMKIYEKDEKNQRALLGYADDQGGFLLAARLTQPRPLRELRKADWPRVGPPITDALGEIGARCPSPLQHSLWKKEAVAIVWAKVLLPAPPATSLDQGWKEDDFFSVGSMIPDLNHTVLFELVKALGAPQLFVQLLLALPRDVCQSELERLVEYITSETSPSDIRFFLDVWWEVMKHKEGEEDTTVSTFSTLIRQHGCETSLDDGLQPPKRFKGDPGSLNHPPAATSLLMVLIVGLKQTYRSITLPRMKCYALANLVELLSVFTELEPEGSTLPVAEYLDKVSSVVNLWTRDTESQFYHRGLDEKVKEAERSLNLLSMAKLTSEELFVGLGFLCSLLHAWEEELQGVLNSSEELCYESYRVLDTLTTFRKNLVCFSETRELGEEETQAPALSLQLP
ncbi:hypothetical protein llap_15765 [Limosa lapponica baueri]|uniref:Glyoxalase domain-containing protein n=1 Tax=Limosa lapponica baueri TaxID=1758121 RepID=A0A2I0TJJ8_LIMLA|nr:hypothetical protein llap_15765 [Limosa lapponica baueri]